MSTIARRFISIPGRSALETWTAIVDLLAPETNSPSRRELESVAGVASSLITRESMSESAAIVWGTGPRIRIYCLHGEDAITADNANEQALAFSATDGDWQMSLPCPPEDLVWVQAALEKKSSRITARDFDTDSTETTERTSGSTSAQKLAVDKEAFFRS